ncbi:MAG: 30S ribosomal protein S3 [Ruminococcaceae bacterium]|jgi:small subunit ribosomal protein S3|nr:30S ribosomal protein S3 [Oscillospiraceae bacterium]
MGQKVNPHGLRVGVIKNWDSRWYAPDEKFGDTLVNDYKIREFVKKSLYQAGVPQVEIERSHNGAIKVYVHCAKPGMVIGREGAGINKLREDISKIAGQSVSVDVLEVKPIDMCAQLVAENIASQLERRISFRRAMKQSIRNTMRMGAKGIKINLNGRIGGAEIARTEHYHEGTIPLQTIRADIDYGFAEANTTYGKIGCKVWIYKGEVLSEVARTKTGADERRKPRTDDRRNGQRRDRRDGDRRNPQRRDGQRDNRFNDPRRPRTAPNGAPAQNARPAAPAPKKEGGAD